MADRERYDLIVVGSGPGGYVACLHAAKLGMKVACVEKEERVGGVCLNLGCIPSKALLDSSDHYAAARHRFREHGIRVGNLDFDLRSMMNRKDRVVNDLAQNLRRLMEGSRISMIRGTARLTDGNEVRVTPKGGRKGEYVTIYASRAVLLATGSEPVQVPGLPFDGERIVNSTDALAFESVPGRLGIVGGGYIGLELGSVWNRLGSKVTVIEMLPRVAGAVDGQVARALERVLSRQGFSFRLQTKVLKAQTVGGEVRVVLEEKGRQEEAVFDCLLVAVGRRPLSRGLGLRELGVDLDGRTGHVIVDAHYRTNLPTLYAVGDLIHGPMLAHKASAEGVAAVECIAGLPGEVNYDAIPSVIYTSPEVASVGITEEKAKERGVAYRVGTYPFTGVGRARCLGEVDGFVKVIAHSRTGRILGVHIMGPHASDIISECVLAMEFNATREDLARTVHGHPTFSEAIREAVLAIK